MTTLKLNASENMKRLFLHMPKCAGSSVVAMLTKAAPELILHDHEHSFFRIPRPERNEVLLQSLFHPAEAPEDKIVIGHFFPVKYLGSAPDHHTRLVTILRDPIERLRSHYRYLCSGNFPEHYVWRKRQAENWSFEDFAFSSEMRNFYSQYFFGVSLGSFAFIGLYENLAVSIRRCCAVLELPLPADLEIPRVNVSPSQVPTEISDATASELRDYHADDYAIYRFAQRKFSESGVATGRPIS